MLILHKKKHGIDFYTVWFAKAPIKKKGIIAYQEYMGSKPRGAKECNTLLTDLTETEEKIKLHFSKTCRNLVNRASRENISIEMFRNKEVTDEIIKDFCDFFEVFWESKSTALEDKQKVSEELKAYREEDALVIGCACINNEKIVYHVYFTTEVIARLRYSASLFRLQENDDGNNVKNLLGIANRGLHFEEMKYFKGLGIQTYDWGGAGRGEDVIHITEFKESFGGTPATYCNFEQANGIKAKLFKLLIKIL